MIRNRLTGDCSSIYLANELLENVQRVAKRSFAINPLPEAVDKNLANDLVVEIHDEYSRVGDAIGGLPRLVLLV